MFQQYEWTIDCQKEGQCDNFRFSSKSHTKDGRYFIRDLNNPCSLSQNLWCFLTYSCSLQTSVSLANYKKGKRKVQGKVPQSQVLFSSGIRLHRTHSGPVCDLAVSGFISPLGSLLCFITVVLSICISMWCFTDEIEDPWCGQKIYL